MRNPSEQPTRQKQMIWAINDQYSRSAPLFAVFTGSSILIRIFIRHLFIYSKVVIVIGFYYLNQRSISGILDLYIHESTYTYQKPKRLLLKCILSLVDSIVAFIMHKNIQMQTFVHAYVSSILMSTAVFSFSIALTCFVIKIGLVRANSIRRGIFGVAQRITILIRTILVFLIWREFFKTIYPNNVWTLRTYGILKFALCIYLIYESWLTLHVFRLNGSRRLEDIQTNSPPGMCAVCYNDILEPKVLPCKHVFCYSCLMKCAEKTKAICPYCRTPFTIPKKIEMSNGRIPLFILISSI